MITFRNSHKISQMVYAGEWDEEVVISKLALEDTETARELIEHHVKTAYGHSQSRRSRTPIPEEIKKLLKFKGPRYASELVGESATIIDESFLEEFPYPEVIITSIIDSRTVFVRPHDSFRGLKRIDVDKLKLVEKGDDNGQ